jgi:hypothetical protein
MGKQEFFFENAERIAKFVKGIGYVLAHVLLRIPLKKPT